MKVTDNKQNLTGRDELGRFAAGNPGRPYGSKGKTSRDTLERIKLMNEGAIQKLWEAVNNGERWAIELVLSKVLPASRTIEFEGLTSKDVLTALVSGDISPDEAKTISATLNNIKEGDFLEKMRTRAGS